MENSLEHSQKYLANRAKEHRAKATDKAVSYLNANGHWIKVKFRKVVPEWIIQLYESDQISNKTGISEADRKISGGQKELNQKEAELKALFDVKEAPTPEPTPETPAFKVALTDKLKQFFKKGNP